MQKESRNQQVISEFAFIYGHCGMFQLTVTSAKPVSTVKDRLKSAIEGKFTLLIHSKKK